MTSNGSDAAGRAWLPAMLLLFVGSGCAALIYEVVWFQLLQLNIGSSAVSLGVLLGVYMGGMCLGSLLLPRFVGPQHHPLRVYAYLELGIGAFGLLALFAVPLLGSIYTMIAGSGPVNVILRAMVAAICLLPPTLLMGATLPAMARYVETTPSGVSWLGFFYGGNLAGAVAGSLIAGYFLLRHFDMATATAVAVVLNVAVAVLAMLIARRTAYKPAAIVEAPVKVTPRVRLIYVVIGLSGATALGAEVVWARLLSLLFGGTAYTFSLILAVFLVGLGLGSTIGSALGRRMRDPRIALGLCQALLCVAIAWAAYSTGASMPYWPINPAISRDLSFQFQLDLMRALWATLPAALLWGASFPLALAGVAEPGQDSGKLVGGVYAANTVGAIFGALITSLALVGVLGTQFSHRALIALCALSAILMLGSALWRPAGKPASPAKAGLAAAGVALVALLCAASAPALPGLLVAYGRYAATWAGINEILYVGEGVTASVAVTRTPQGVVNYHNAGKVQASSQAEDMRLQRMLGHMTTLLPDNPAKVLVIGCGAGVTAGAVSIDPAVKSETIAEIEPLVPKVASEYFGAYNFQVITNPKVKVHLDDARHFLLTTNEKFDAITSDPLDPWVKGAATLYTREFFQELKSHLNPGGVVTLFVQMYESTDAATKSEVATFLEAFPNGAVFANNVNGLGYDLILYGSKEDRPIDVDAIEAKLKLPQNAPILKSLSEVGIYSAVDLLGTYSGSREDLGAWMADAQINTDRNLRLQYLAGLGLNLHQSDTIYRNMIAETRYPQNLFTGRPETLRALEAAMQRTWGRPPS